MVSFIVTQFVVNSILDTAWKEAFSTSGFQRTSNNPFIISVWRNVNGVSNREASWRNNLKKNKFFDEVIVPVTGAIPDLATRRLENALGQPKIN